MSTATPTPRRLQKINEVNADVALTTGTADTSQWGNHSGFRNATLDETPVHINDTWMSQKIQSGTLRFDFVSTTRPPLTSLVSNRNFEPVLLKAAHIIGNSLFDVRPTFAGVLGSALCGMARRGRV